MFTPKPMTVNSVLDRFLLQNPRGLRTRQRWCDVFIWCKQFEGFQPQWKYPEGASWLAVLASPLNLIWIYDDIILSGIWQLQIKQGHLVVCLLRTTPPTINGNFMLMLSFHPPWSQDVAAIACLVPTYVLTGNTCHCIHHTEIIKNNKHAYCLTGSLENFHW